MPRIAAVDVFPVDLPFRAPFRHSAATRSSSASLFVRCTTGAGAVGWGESLPRVYVTGETRDGAVAMLRERIAPRLLGLDLASTADLEGFLTECDGRTPGWVPAPEPQGAAWCAVDLALLDAWGHELGEPVWPSPPGGGSRVRYSGVLSSSSTGKLLRSCLKARLFGLRAIKMKVDRDTPVAAVARAARWLPRDALRIDANMAWSVDEALRLLPRLAALGVTSFEQPLAADDLQGAARLVRDTGLEIMADESCTHRESLQRLVDAGACTAVNLRISKCGGLVAARRRGREARSAGLTVQVGCQVGESSLLSAAHLALLSQLDEVRFAEGCFGRHLLRQDPAQPLLQFGFGGLAPPRPGGPGLGVEIAPWLGRSSE